MALVMLPSELPWWSVIQRKLTAIEGSDDLDKILDIMQRIHDHCNISVDPEEDHFDTEVLDGLKNFILNDCDETERHHFINHTLKILCRYAKNLRQYRPPRGMEFSLQQNTDSVEFDYNFVASLLANAFFSTYPKRTKKNFPTLLDFNFTYFFRELSSNVQKAKLRSFLYYFDWFDQHSDEKQENKLKLSRKVMTGKQWLTIEDWIECPAPLCSLEVKHDVHMENSPENLTHTIFSHPDVGQTVLLNGSNQESIQLITHPELLIALLYCEKLEDNEVLFVENVRQVSRIVDPKNKAIFEKFEVPRNKSLLCMDAENYVNFPPAQFEEDNFLREINKCLLAFRQNNIFPNPTSKLVSTTKDVKIPKEVKERGRLSPIGENSLTPSASEHIIVTIPSATSTPTSHSTLDSDKTGDKNAQNGVDKRRSWLCLPENKLQKQLSNESQNHKDEKDTQDKRRLFILLGSSGERLPVNRPTTLDLVERNNKRNSFFNRSGSSDEEEFYSARNSLTEPDSDDENFNDHRYSVELETPENRFRFAKALKDALKLENGYTESTDDGTNSIDDDYNVDISVTGSKVHDKNIRVKRGTSSCGFILEDEENIECMNEEEKRLLKRLSNLDYNRSKLKRNETNDSSKYSFDSDLSSELEEMYDQFAKWLNDPVDNKDRKLDSRDIAVMKFAKSLLKRTLSESYAGKPENELLLSPTDSNPDEKRTKIAYFRSLSLELAKHKNKIAAQLKLENSSEQTEPTPNTANTMKKPKTKKSSIEIALKPASSPNPPKLSRLWSITSTKMEENINCEVTLKINQLAQKHIYGNGNMLRSIATGNWGCGTTGQGDVQIKLIIQWLAASMAGVPVLVYHTASHESLSKLDTLVRVLLDRQWTVADLATNTLLYAKEILNNPSNYKLNSSTFFDRLIRLEKH